MSGEILEGMQSLSEQPIRFILVLLCSTNGVLATEVNATFESAADQCFGSVQVPDSLAM